MQKILVILQKLENWLKGTKPKKSSGIIKTQPIITNNDLFDAYTDEALMAAIEAGVIEDVCNAATIDFQMVKEHRNEKARIN